MSIIKRNVNCKVCNSPMQAEYGIVQMSTQTGVTWWKCSSCERRIRERYRIEDNKIVSLSAVEVLS